MSFLRPLQNNTYAIYEPLGVRLLNRLGLGFNNLRENKFRHNLNLLIIQIHYVDALLKLRIQRITLYTSKIILSFQTTPTNNLNNIDTALDSLNPNDLLRVILYGNKSFNKETNCKIHTVLKNLF